MRYLICMLLTSAVLLLSCRTAVADEAWEPAPPHTVPVLAFRSVDNASAAVSLPLDIRDLGVNFEAHPRSVGESLGAGRIVAWCPQPVNGTVRVGAISVREVADLDAGQREGIALNRFRFLLDCP